MSQTNLIPAERVGGLFIEQHELEIVQRILRQHLPDRNVWAFGSRATGVRLKRFSDLDLAIAGKMTLAEHAHLAEEFDESPLPFKTDIVELDELAPNFKHRIGQDFILLQGSAHSS